MLEEHNSVYQLSVTAENQTPSTFSIFVTMCKLLILAANLVHDILTPTRRISG